jgi:hypothetical protein
MRNRAHAPLLSPSATWSPPPSPPPPLRTHQSQEESVTPGFAILLMYALLLLILGAQTGLVIWKQKHKRSYELVTLLGLWLMPAIFSAHLQFWRFLIVWSAFTGVTLYLLYICSGKKKVDKDTPRKVRRLQLAGLLSVFGWLRLVG